MKPRLARPAFAGVGLLVLALSLTGCFNPFSPSVFREGGVASNAPVPDSPENTLLLFRWCWLNRAADVYEEIFTDDYVFAFSATDSAGNAFRDRPYTREDELNASRHIFDGGGNEPPATSITLNFDQILRKSTDPRPGKRNKWHWRIETSVALTVRNENQAYESQGRSVYYFVRGDSAVIPDALQQRGFGRDSTRWWIERWEDQTVGSGLLAELARSGVMPPSAAEIEVRPDGEWHRTGTITIPAALASRLAARAGTPAAGASGASTASSGIPEFVSLGTIKTRFLQ